MSHSHMNELLLIVNLMCDRVRVLYAHSPVINLADSSSRYDTVLQHFWKEQITNCQFFPVSFGNMFWSRRQALRLRYYLAIKEIFLLSDATGLNLKNLRICCFNVKLCHVVQSLFALFSLLLKATT